MNQESLNITIEKLDKIADILYKGGTEEGFAYMNEVLPDISMIATGMMDPNISTRLMNEALVPALSAMEQQDGVWLADIIYYELLKILREL